MTHEPLPRKLLTSQLRWAMGRGLPPQDAEDVVFEAYQRARQSYDAKRGTFDAFFHTLVRNGCTSWWRHQQTRHRAHQHLRLVRTTDTHAEERAAAYQSQVLEALDASERTIFSAWAMQKHIGKGQVTSEEVARSIGLTKVEYENAKRRLKTRLARILEQLGLSVSQLLHGVDSVERTG